MCVKSRFLFFFTCIFFHTYGYAFCLSAWSLRLEFVMYLGILLYMGIMLYVYFVTDCQRERLLGIEFVMLANHDKT